MSDGLGKTLMALRKKNEYTQGEVAAMLDALGLPTVKQSVSRWEQDINTPNARQFIALCSIYRVRDVEAVFMDKKLPHCADALNRVGREKVEQYARDLIASGLYSIKSDAPVRELRRLPLYDLPVSAGTGQFLDSSDYELVEVDDAVPSAANFGVRISGDSMEPRFHTGGVAWVQQQPVLSDGETGIFLLNGSAYLKTLKLTGDGARLVSLNPEYAPIEVCEEDDFRVFGRVVG